jgi:hypothetical protein
MIPIRIAAVMLMTFVAVILSHLATVAQTTDRQAVRDP